MRSVFLQDSKQYERVGIHRRAVALTITIVVLFAAHVGASPHGISAFRDDPRGFSRVQAQSAPTTERSWSEALSAEELALGSAVIAQVEVASVESPARYTGRLIRNFSSVTSTSPRSSRPFAFISGPYVLSPGEAPVMLLYPNTNDGTRFAAQRSGGAGFVHDGAITFRRSNDRSESYSLAHQRNVFSCLAASADTAQARRCITSRLRDFGIVTDQDRNVYARLRISDPAGALLWFLMVRREPHAKFPARLCESPFTTTSCASAKVFSDRLGLAPGE